MTWLLAGLIYVYSRRVTSLREGTRDSIQTVCKMTHLYENRMTASVMSDDDSEQHSIQNVCKMTHLYKNRMTASVMSDDDSEQHHHRRTGRKTAYYTHRSLPSGSVPKAQLRRTAGGRGEKSNATTAITDRKATTVRVREHRNYGINDGKLIKARKTCYVHLNGKQ